MRNSPGFAAGAPEEPGRGGVGVFGRGGDAVLVGVVCEAEAVERVRIGIVLRVEIDGPHGHAGPVALRDFHPVGEIERRQGHAPHRNCPFLLPCQRLGECEPLPGLALTGFGGSQAGRLFDETVHQRQTLRSGFEVAVLRSFKLPSKQLDVFFVQAQIVQGVGGGLSERRLG